MFLVILACLAFFSCALPDSALGVAWPGMRTTFGVPTSAAGSIPPVGVAATLAATALAGHLVGRFGVGRLLAASAALSTAGLVVSAGSTTLWQFLISVAIIGLSGGAVDATLNAYAARSFGARKINLLHASYGVGAAVSPLVVTAVQAFGSGWQWAYALIAALQAVLSIIFLITWRRWGDGADHGTARRGPVAHRTRGGRGRVWTTRSVVGMVAVAVQSGIESSVALWAYTFLTEAVGVAVVVAGTLASGYWVALFVGRIVLGSLAERTGPWPVLGLGVAGLVLGSVLVIIAVPETTVVAVLVFGVAAAPIYPLLILTTPQRTSLDVSDRVVGYQAAASSLGAATLPLLVGLAMAGSVAWFAPAVAAQCAVAVVLQLVMRALLRRQGSAAEGAPSRR